MILVKLLNLLKFTSLVTIFSILVGTFREYLYNFLKLLMMFYEFIYNKLSLLIVEEYEITILAKRVLALIIAPIIIGAVVKGIFFLFKKLISKQPCLTCLIWVIWLMLIVTYIFAYK